MDGDRDREIKEMDSKNLVTVDEDCRARTVYVGSLGVETTEELLLALFRQYGPIRSCKLIKEPPGDPFAFIEFKSHQDAAIAIGFMQGRTCMGKTLKLSWAYSSCPDTSQHYNIFIGDFSHETTETELRSAFAKFGTISACRIVRDPNTMMSRSYGFITFVSKEAAETAIHQMNGAWIGNRSIKTNWATRRVSKSGFAGSVQSDDKATYESVASRTHPYNSTVFCGNISNGISESLLNTCFSTYGPIVEIRVFKAKGYGFVKFADKSSAVHAILGMHKSNVNGNTLNVSWGKELPSTLNQTTSTYGFGSNVHYHLAQNDLSSYFQNFGTWSPEDIGRWYALATQTQHPWLSQQQQYYNTCFQGYSTNYGVPTNPSTHDSNSNPPSRWS